MLVTLLVKFRNKDCKTTELGLLLQVLPVRIVTFVETLGSHLNCKCIQYDGDYKVVSLQVVLQLFFWRVVFQYLYLHAQGHLIIMKKAT